MTLTGIYKPVAPVVPPGPAKGFAHPGCYLRPTNNCSRTISGEHIVSRAIFEEFDFIEVDGAPWLAPEEKRRIGVKSATANVLCDRHNSAFSPLDTEAARFFRTHRDIGADLNRKSLSRKSRAYLFSGATLELWLLKVACGAFFSGSAARDRTRLSDHEFNIYAAIAAMYQGHWMPNAGLYVKAVGQQIHASDRVSFAPLTADGEKRVCGYSVSVRGLIFDIVFDTTGLRPLPELGYFFRPPQIILTDHQRHHVIYLSWPGASGQNNIQLTLSRKRS